MMNQNDIATYFNEKYGTKLDQARISRILGGLEPVSWPFAHALSLEFPGRDVASWKTASLEDIKRAFNQLADL